MATYDIPTITGYTTVNAASKSDALSQVPNASLVKPVVAGGAITPQNLTPTTPTNVPVAAETPATSDLATLIDSTTKTVSQNLDKQATALQGAKSTALQDLLQSLNAPGKETLTAQQYAPVDTAQSEVSQLNNQLLSEQVSLRRRLDALNKNPQGLFGGALAQEASRIQQESLAKQADIAVLQMAAQGKYDSAKQIADRAIAMQQEQANQNLAIRQAVYNDVKDQLTTAEKRAFDFQQQQIKNATDMAAYKEKARYDQIIRQSDPLYKAQLRKAQIEADVATENNQPIRVDLAQTNLPSAEANTSALRGIFASTKVTPANKTAVATGLSLMQAAQDLANANPEGKFAGMYPLRGTADFFLPEFMKRQKTVQNDALISALDLQTQFWASGAALSDYQTALVQKMVPTKTDTDAQVRTKLNELVNYMLGQTSSRLITDGIDYKPAKVDLFEPTTLLSNASPEQMAQLQSEGLIK
jgi:hypothetical protein